MQEIERDFGGSKNKFAVDGRSNQTGAEGESR